MTVDDSEVSRLREVVKELKVELTSTKTRSTHSARIILELIDAPLLDTGSIERVCRSLIESFELQG